MPLPVPMPMASPPITAALPSPPLLLHARIRLADARNLAFVRPKLVRSGGRRALLIRASGGSGDGPRAEAYGAMVVGSLRATVSALPPAIAVMRRSLNLKAAVAVCVAFTFLVISVRHVIPRNRTREQRGSVADLVRRGQLKPDRRGISKPLKYEDPFNNPLVKVGNNSTVEICGKVYRLAPVTLTKEQQSSHQKRRSRAYQWKRPTIFLKEGDEIPPDIDPETVGWIPANHPFATTVSDIDEETAQNNVYQTHGVPFRIRAEHEAMQRKLEKLQNEQKLNKVVIDPNSLRDLERSTELSTKSNGQQEPNLSTSQQRDSVTVKPDQESNSSEKM